MNSLFMGVFVTPLPPNLLCLFYPISFVYHLLFVLFSSESDLVPLVLGFLGPNCWPSPWVTLPS